MGRAMAARARTADLAAAQAIEQARVLLDRVPARHLGRVAWSEKWAVRLGQNKTRHGLHFESEATHLALLREAGFDRIETRPDAGLGSNVLLLAIKPSNLDK